jgi:hypothetical protein
VVLLEGNEGQLLQRFPLVLLVSLIIIVSSLSRAREMEGNHEESCHNAYFAPEGLIDCEVWDQTRSANNERSPASHQGAL